MANKPDKKTPNVQDTYEDLHQAVQQDVDRVARIEQELKRTKEVLAAALRWIDEKRAPLTKAEVTTLLEKLEG